MRNRFGAESAAACRGVKTGDSAIGAGDCVIGPRATHWPSFYNFLRFRFDGSLIHTGKISSGKINVQFL